MKKIYFLILLGFGFNVSAQRVDSIYINLYTDSLKLGTYNYINVDGLLSNGSYQPLDTNDIIFTATDGKFIGNSLWLDPDFKKDTVKIKVVMRKNHALNKEFVMYIKKEEDPPLPTEQELLDKMKKQKRKEKIKNI